MIQLDFVLYRFVCDISSFTGLCSNNAAQRDIPDALSYHCSWSRTPRSKANSCGSTGVYHVDGATEDIRFKEIGADVVLTFSTQSHQLILDSERDVVTFALRPSTYSGAGPLPAVAKCALDPSPFFDKPKKNYAIKLRNACGAVTGKLLFSLYVHEIEDARGAHSSNAATFLASKPSMAGQMSLERNPSRDRLLKTPPRATSNVPSFTPPPDQKPMQDDDVGVDRGEQQLAQPMPTTTAMRSTPVRGTSIFTKCTPGAVQSLDIQLERIVVRSDSIDLDHPAPLLLGGEYSVRIRFGSYSFSTTPVVCCEPKEVVYKGQQACITLKPVDGSEKLRFSLLEGKRQVARFSLDPAKLKADVKEWKEYAIPFRYNPTGQRTALDVRVRRVETNGNRSPMNWRASPQPPAAITASSTAADAHATTSSNTAPKPLVDTTSPSNVHAESGADSHAPRWSWSPEHPHNTTNPVAQKASQACSRLRSSPHRGLETSIDANTPTSGPLASSDTNRTNTPLRGSQWSAKDADQTVSGYRRARACEASSVQGGWEHTFMQQRPPPLTSNLADLPADRRPPSEHEKYIAEVLARLERHQQGPRQHTSLEEEWVGWREQRERSRCDSVSDMHGRSTSVNSVVSRADSVVSVVSRRASAPRPTHSNADHAVMTPFSPDTSAYRHHRRRRSPPARNPLI